MQLNIYRASLGSILLLWAILFVSCADPTTLGSDLLEGDRINTVFTDTITVQSRTVSGDSVLTYAPGPIWLTSYLFGDFKDPVFGNTYAEVYAQPTLELSSFSFLPPDFNDALLDSVVLILPYSSGGFYGNTEQEFSIQVLELQDSLSRDSAYYSNTRLNASTIIGSKTFIPSLDSVTFLDYRSNSPDTISLAQLRVPLSDLFGRKLISQDTSTFRTVSDFLQFFKGFAIRPATPTDGMISFDMVPSGDYYNAGIFVYYQRDSFPRQYRFPVSFSSPVVGHLENDHTGSLVEPFIDRPGFNDTLSYVQGTNGLLLELNFPHLENLQDVIVNKAELVISRSQTGSDNPDLFPPAEQFYIFYYDADVNDYIPIDDVILPATGAINTVFGGLLEAGSNGQPDVYRMNISAYFQEMLKNDAERDIPDVLYLAVTPRSERASRSTIYGASHPKFPIKLNLTYTTQ